MAIGFSVHQEETSNMSKRCKWRGENRYSSLDVNWILKMIKIVAFLFHGNHHHLCKEDQNYHNVERLLEEVMEFMASKCFATFPFFKESMKVTETSKMANTEEQAVSSNKCTQTDFPDVLPQSRFNEGSKKKKRKKKRKNKTGRSCSDGNQAAGGDHLPASQKTGDAQTSRSNGTTHDAVVGASGPLGNGRGDGDDPKRPFVPKLKQACEASGDHDIGIPSENSKGRGRCPSPASDRSSQRPNFGSRSQDGDDNIPIGIPEKDVPVASHTPWDHRSFSLANAELSQQHRSNDTAPLESCGADTGKRLESLDEPPTDAPRDSTPCLTSLNYQGRGVKPTHENALKPKAAFLAPEQSMKTNLIVGVIDGTAQHVRKLGRQIADRKFQDNYNVYCGVLNQLLKAKDGNYREGKEWYRGNLLGRGKFGTVHVGKDAETRNTFAMKEMHLKDFRKDELEIWVGLNHQSIVPLLGVVIEWNKVFMFMEYIEGGTLAELINKGSLGEQMALHYLEKILIVLEYMHNKKCIHRDIKAENMLLSLDKRELVLCDMGFVKIIGHGDKQEVAGTITHMAPEVLTKVYSYKVDVWSACCTLLHMLTGGPPWVAKHGNNKEEIRKQLLAKKSPLDEIQEKFSPEVMNILTQGLAPDPLHRQTAGYLKAQTQRWLKNSRLPTSLSELEGGFSNNASEPEAQGQQLLAPPPGRVDASQENVQMVQGPARAKRTKLKPACKFNNPPQQPGIQQRDRTCVAGGFPIMETQPPGQMICGMAYPACIRRHYWDFATVPHEKTLLQDEACAPAEACPRHSLEQGLTINIISEDRTLLYKINERQRVTVDEVCDKLRHKLEGFRLVAFSGEPLLGSEKLMGDMVNLLRIPL
ncbi:uncharacterized protein LOC116948914 isoform X1 [Petromyzon marinus]|uniref:uncharacterized protein LOC116948914 isoform X1 n=2 Tax=Petromyzon marinus TaxID=7757 RepID=UPI003F7174BC